MVEKRFWDKVDVKSDLSQCWEWRRGLVHGYGAYEEKLSDGRFKSVRAHRYLYQIIHGKLDGSHIQVRHKCDNRCCVNPTHLTHGTNKNNVYDRVLRRTGKNGVASYGAVKRAVKHNYFNDDLEAQFAKAEELHDKGFDAQQISLMTGLDASVFT